MESGNLIREFTAHNDTVTSMAFTINGQNLVTASRDRTIKLWSLPGGKLMRTLAGHESWVNKITVHPNGIILASAGRDGIKLWDLSTGKLLDTLDGHSDWVSAIAFSPDGKTLASGGFDRKIKIWRIQ